LASTTLPGNLRLKRLLLLDDGSALSDFSLRILYVERVCQLD
jgi:hypothetical protein